MTSRFASGQCDNNKHLQKKTEDGTALANILSIEKLTSDIKLVTMKVDDNSKVEFTAGQFIGVVDGRCSIEPPIFPGTYSIASRPSELPLIRFAVGEDHNPRNLRHHLYFHAKAGDPVVLDAQGSGTVAITPRMMMNPIGGPGGLMLIGGGSAVMGLVSIVEELLHDEQGQKIPAIKLFHSNRSNDDIPFYERMTAHASQHSNFQYFPHITAKVPEGYCRGNPGRITPQDLAHEIPGIRLFCICGSGIFCEAMVNMLLNLGVWPGSIRTDYTTRVDPSRKLMDLQKTSIKQQSFFSSVTDSMSMTSIGSGDSFGQASMTRFEACADATQAKGSMCTSSSRYLETYGIETLLHTIVTKMEDDQPDHPLQYIQKELAESQRRLPEVSNTQAADPNFWINYWETDNVTWQAPVVSPWLEKYLEYFMKDDEEKIMVMTNGDSKTKKRNIKKFRPWFSSCRGMSPSAIQPQQQAQSSQQKQRHVFVPLCGKSLDMKLLLEAGHHVIGADCSGIACMDFFTENNIVDYVQEVVNHPDGKRIIRHRSTTQPIELYEGDIFDLTPEIVGPVDRILDRAALVALHPSMIANQYLPLLTSLLQPGGKVLFASVSKLPFPKAPPHAYTQEQIEGVLRPFFSKIEPLEVHSYRVNAGIVSEPIYMLTSCKGSN